MVKPVTIIVGGSGRGKTTSIRTLNPKKTIIFNTEYKPLPFKNAGFGERNVYLGTSEALLTSLSQLINSDKPEAKEIEVIVIDSFSAWTDMLREECEFKFKGFERWNAYNSKVSELFKLLKKSNRYAFLIGHDEVIQSEEEGTQRRLKVAGKQWEGMCEKEAVVVLWATTAKSETGSPRYVFQTQTNGVTSAKSPMGMFDDFEIDNDLGMVVSKIADYFEGVSEPVQAVVSEPMNAKVEEVINKKSK